MIINIIKSFPLKNIQGISYLSHAVHLAQIFYSRLQAGDKGLGPFKQILYIMLLQYLDA
jgi:hypothetical protein